MNITPSVENVTIDEIRDAIADGKELAEIPEVVMDEEFLRRCRHDWCWLGGNGIPPNAGWYEVDRANGRLTAITDGRASQLEWHERLFVYPSALSAAEKKSALALYIGDEYDDNRLSALYLCGPDVVARVALKSSSKARR
jgi:hypothetical protein